MRRSSAKAAEDSRILTWVWSNNDCFVCSSDLKDDSVSERSVDRARRKSQYWLSAE